MQNLTCPNCGSPLHVNPGSVYAVCPYCHTQVLLSELIFTGGGSHDISAESAFSIQGATLIKYTGSGQTPVIPQGVRKIGREAFQHTAIISVVIPEGITEIGSYAFEDCDELTFVSLPSTLRKIGNRAFRRCYSLNDINYSGDWISIDKGEDVFIGCPCDPYAHSPEVDSGYIEQVRKRAGVCLYCGGDFRLFSKKCSKCGRIKSY